MKRVRILGHRMALVTLALTWGSVRPVYANVQNEASAHFGFLNTAIDMATAVIPAISLLAIVGGIVMWGIGGGGEGAMKKVGPVIMAFGLAGFILTQGRFLGIGGTTF